LQEGDWKISLSEKKNVKTPIKLLNIAQFNRGQSSKVFKSLIEEDKTGFILKNGKELAVVISYERYLRLLTEGVDINDY